jgi:hypothetical protein
MLKVVFVNVMTTARFLYSNDVLLIVLMMMLIVLIKISKANDVNDLAGSLLLRGGGWGSKTAKIVSPLALR